MSRALGIDVSSVQGTIDWTKVATTVQFVYVKATNGIGHDLDTFFSRNVAGARQAGLVTSLYHWWVWTRDPVEQAANIEWAVNLAGGVDLPVCLDFESPDPSKWGEKYVDPIRLVPNLLACAEETARRLGRTPVIYTYPWFMAALPPDTVTELAKYDLWIASGNNYEKAWSPTDTSVTPVPHPWATWKIWQYSGNGGMRVPGIPGDVDRDEFNGTLDDLKAWGSTSRIIPATDMNAAVDTFTRK